MFEMSSAFLRRNGLAAVAVLSLHVGLIWMLQSALKAPVPELVVPVSLLSQSSNVSDAPAPVQPKAPVTPSPRAPRAETAKASPTPQVTPQVTKSEASTPAAMPVAISATAVTTATTSTTTAPTSGNTAAPSQANGSPSNAVVSSASSPAAPALQMPSSDADYLRNPKPAYPPLSKRLNEQGTAIHSVLIGVDGKPVSAKLVKSSGFDRLDKAAYEAVMQWRYVPGKRQGVPEAMTFNVPIKWVLE